MSRPLIEATSDEQSWSLKSPTSLPRAATFLWNKHMMIQITCRGYATAQFMQPEPAKYAHAPNLEAKTFMQPEQGYFAHHPGRFVYVRDDETQEMWSAPYEPVRASLDYFNFVVGKYGATWIAQKNGIEIQMELGIPLHEVMELWTVRVRNFCGRARKLSIFTYFPIGNMSWMNQSAIYNRRLRGIVASSITPYQKAADYERNKFLKDKTYLLSEREPTSWETSQETFEGEGGLHNPDGLKQKRLGCGNASYENPAGVIQHTIVLDRASSETYRFMFGPAQNEENIASLKHLYLHEQGFALAAKYYKEYIDAGRGLITIDTPDKHFDKFINDWLPRQVYYHGDVNRLTTDPQTRNYLQDSMGMAYIRPEATRIALCTALAQQLPSGELPEGIILVLGAELKYINQVPHTDHCVWLPMTLQAYLAETGNYSVLDHLVSDSYGQTMSVYDRICGAMNWLESFHDHRTLNFIRQGDWCDPMNMVGPRGFGVSGWLTLAASYALQLWADIVWHKEPKFAKEYKDKALKFSDAANAHLWDGDWYARGITDDNRTFGVRKDTEGRIWLNPQSFAILSRTASPEKRERMITAIAEHLETENGIAMFAPPYTGMVPDIGRVTQKYPGTAENGSVYNHAAAFYAAALYSVSENTTAFEVLRAMIPGPEEDDYIQKGQMPLFVPNYYRVGGKFQGRSSGLFNTGTAAWMLRIVIEGLCGLVGTSQGLRVSPRLPRSWPGMKCTRKWRGAMFEVTVSRRAKVEWGSESEDEVANAAKEVRAKKKSGNERGKIEDKNEETNNRGIKFEHEQEQQHSTRVSIKNRHGYDLKFPGDQEGEVGMWMVKVDGNLIDGNVIRGCMAGATYRVDVTVPADNK